MLYVTGRICDRGCLPQSLFVIYKCTEGVTGVCGYNLSTGYRCQPTTNSNKYNITLMSFLWELCLSCNACEETHQ